MANKIVLTLTYADDSTRNVEIDDVPSANLADVKQKIFDFNVLKCGLPNDLTEGSELTPNTDYTKVLVSDNGAELIGIGAAKIVSTTTTVIKG